MVLCFQYNYRNRGSLTFDPLTLVPIQVKLMKTELLTQKEVRSVPPYPSSFVFGLHAQWVGNQPSADLVRCVPAGRLGERLPQEVPGGGGGRATAAGQDGGAGLADQGDAANRLTAEAPPTPCFGGGSTWWPLGGALTCFFVKLLAAAVLIKIKLEGKRDSV